LQTKLWDSKTTEVPTLGISGLPLKCHLDASLVARHRVFYKGEGGGFLEVRAMVSLVNPG